MKVLVLKSLVLIKDCAPVVKSILCQPISQFFLMLHIWVYKHNGRYNVLVFLAIEVWPVLKTDQNVKCYNVKTKHLALIHLISLVAFVLVDILASYVTYHILYQIIVCHLLVKTDRHVHRVMMVLLAVV